MLKCYLMFWSKIAFYYTKEERKLFFLAKFLIEFLKFQQKVFNLSSNLLSTFNECKRERKSGDESDGRLSVIFQKPLHYQHENLWSGNRLERGWRENLIKLYVFALVLLAVVFAAILLVVSYFCQFSSSFLFSTKLFVFEKENFNEIEFFLFSFFFFSG